MKPINVLSLFDGMSCGQIALNRAGIKYNKYYASEIDKYAIQVTQSHFPNTAQLGDINNWRKWTKQIPVPDLIIAGSPCQGFSNAGKGLNFDDPRSKLFFVFLAILKYYKKKNPNLLFLLENVKMKSFVENFISSSIGKSPVLIDSALVSAQRRKRNYWSNFTVVAPSDRRIFLRDVVQPDYEIDDKYIYFTKHAGIIKCLSEKAGCLTGGAHSGGNHSDMTLLRFPVNSAAIRNQVTKNGIETQLNVRKDGKANSVVPSYPLKLNGIQTPSFIYRRLTPVECERLQTVPDNWTSMVSDTQRYKMLGNGWTVDVIVHIFSCMNKKRIE